MKYLCEYSRSDKCPFACIVEFCDPIEPLRDTKLYPVPGCIMGADMSPPPVFMSFSGNMEPHDEIKRRELQNDIDEHGRNVRLRRDDIMTGGKEGCYYITFVDSGDYVVGPFDTLKEATDSFDMNKFDKGEYDIEYVEYNAGKMTDVRKAVFTSHLAAMLDVALSSLMCAKVDADRSDNTQYSDELGQLTERLSSLRETMYTKLDDMIDGAEE